MAVDILFQHRHPDKWVTEMETWKAVNNPDARFTYKLLEANIGYLNIVGIGPAVDVEIPFKPVSNLDKDEALWWR